MCSVIWWRGVKKIRAGFKPYREGHIRPIGTRRQGSRESLIVECPNSVSLALVDRTNTRIGH